MALTKSAHTPGPWRESWDYKPLGSGGGVIAHAVGPQHVCDGVPLRGENHEPRFLQPDHATMERVFADARLIAAAPDLLLTLERLAERMEQSARIGCKADFLRQLISEWSTAVRAAISKATPASPTTPDDPNG